MTKKMPEIDFASVLASTVHDMKNSLCMLIQSIDLLQLESPQLSEQAKDELARLNYEANRLNSNLLQLLSIYRLERNQFPVQVDEHYLADVIEEVLLKNQYYISQRKIGLRIEQPAELHWYLDYDLIVNLLNDVVANALRYCQQQVLITVGTEALSLCIEVHDDGPGFPEKMLNNNEIDMNKPDLTHNHTGLGIFFAKLIACAHRNKERQGNVSLYNGGHFGGGVFRLTLP